MTIKVPKYELVAGEIDGTDDIVYNGVTIRIHQVSFTEPDTPMEKAIMHLNYDVVDGDPAGISNFANDIAAIAFDILEKNVAMRELKNELATLKEKRSGN